MKFNNIPDFLDALQERMDEIKDGEITSATDIDGCDVTAEDDIYEPVDVDSIVEEARTTLSSDSEITEFIFEHLSKLDFTPEEIFEILKEYGF